MVLVRKVAGAFLALWLVSAAAFAAYPDHPIRLVVPYAAGGGVDSTARVLAQRLTERLGQTVVVENHPGAGSNIGNAYVARAAPDGYTLLQASPSAAINATLYRNLSYDLLRDFVPVSGVISGEMVLVTAPDSPITSVDELVARARQQPGKMIYGSAGIGSTEHLAGEMLAQLAKVELQHLPYKGTGPAMADLLGGRIQFMFGGASALVPLVRSGAMRGLAVTSAHRIEELPAVPTVQEAVPGYEITLWNGILAPKGTPPDIVARLSREIAGAAMDAQETFRSMGGVPLPLPPDELGKLIAAQVALWRDIITKANIRVN